MVQVGNFTERGNEQIPPRGGDKIERIVKFQYFKIKTVLSCTQVKETLKNGDYLKCSWNFEIQLFHLGTGILVFSVYLVSKHYFGKFENGGLR